MNIFGKLSAATVRIISKLKTTRLIQDYIDTNITYDPHREDRAVNEVVQDGKAECYNGALFACACLEFHGFESVGLVQLQPVEDEEHMLAVYQMNSKWGAIAQSKFLGLKSREPIYLSIHDLAVSYKEFYFGFDGHYSLAGHTDFFSLEKYDRRWINELSVVKRIAHDLAQAEVTYLLGNPKPYLYVSPERYWKEVQFIPEGTMIPKRYLKAKP